MGCAEARQLSGDFPDMLLTAANLCGNTSDLMELGDSMLCRTEEKVLCSGKEDRQDGLFTVQIGCMFRRSAPMYLNVFCVFHGVKQSADSKIGKVDEKYIEERLTGQKIYGGSVFVVGPDVLPQETKDSLEGLIRSLISVENVFFARTGSTVCAHCGPGTLGVMYIEG